MRKLNLVLLVVFLALVACSKQQVRPYGGQSFAPTDPERVEVFYSFPARAHRKIGAIDIRHYQPGWGDPTVHDAVERLQESGAELGAHAVVVTDSQTTGERKIRVMGEAIRWRN